MQTISPAAFAVLAGNRVERFHYELHRQDGSGWHVQNANLQLVRNCTITHDRQAKIKRTASFEMVDDPSVLYLADAIRVFWHFRAAAPGSTEFSYVMGTFYMNTPDLPLLKSGSVRRIQCYDALVLLDQAKLTDWLTVPALDNVIGTVLNILTTNFPYAGIQIPLSTDLFGEPKVFAAGMSLLDVCNRMLAYVNYTSLRADVNGSLISSVYVKPSARAPELTYSDTSTPLFIGDASVLTRDAFDQPNRWVRTVSQPGKGAPYPLLSQYDLPASDPLSAANRRHVIADYAAVDVVSQAKLDFLVKAEAEEASLGRTKLHFSTPLMPHDWADCLTIQYSRLPADQPSNAFWIEQSWTFPCVPGGRMDHIVATVATAT